MIHAILTVVFAAIIYALCLFLGLPSIVGIVAAVLVLLSGFPTGAYGSRAR